MILMIKEIFNDDGKVLMTEDNSGASPPEYSVTEEEEDDDSLKSPDTEYM